MGFPGSIAGTLTIANLSVFDFVYNTVRKQRCQLVDKSGQTSLLINKLQRIMQKQKVGLQQMCGPEIPAKVDRSGIAHFTIT